MFSVLIEFCKLAPVATVNTLLRSEVYRLVVVGRVATPAVIAVTTVPKATPEVAPGFHITILLPKKAGWETTSNPDGPFHFGKILPTIDLAYILKIPDDGVAGSEIPW